MLPLIARANWRDHKNYPKCNDSDATMWAWEFLRRNYFYEDIFKKIEQTSKKVDTQYERERFAVAWNMSDLLDPSLSYEQLKALPTCPLKDFNFTGQQPDIDMPIAILDEDEVYFPTQGFDLALKYGTPVIGCVEQPIFRALNDVHIKICLDGDVDYQLDVIKKRLHEKLITENKSGVKISHKQKDVRLFTLQHTATSEVFDSFSLILEAKKVRYTHLWYALRIIDALATEANRLEQEGADTNLDGKAIQRFCTEVLSQFKKERVKGHPAFISVKPILEKHNEKDKIVHSGELNMAQFNAAKSFGLWYVLGKKYVSIAHADLVGQVNNYRSNKKKISS